MSIENAKVERNEQKNLLFHFISSGEILARYNMKWIESVGVFDNQTADYFLVKKTSLWADGSELEMNMELNRKGWDTPEEVMISKENITFDELLKCIAYGKSYRITYESLVKKPLAPINIKISEFLNSVNSEADIQFEQILLTKQAVIDRGICGIEKLLPLVGDISVAPRPIPSKNLIMKIFAALEDLHTQ